MVRSTGFGILALVAGLACGATAFAHSSYVSLWTTRYPSSTLDERMTATFGQSCYVCHQPEGISVLGTCYLTDIKARLDAGRSISQALGDVDVMDSDGDGASNHDEILAVRTDLPGVIGYHPGRTGPLGVTCGIGVGTTGVSETPPAPCPGDANHDGFTNGADLSVLLGQFGASVAAGSGADFNENGVVNGADLSVLLGNFGCGN